jgi:hypothetical protein
MCPLTDGHGVHRQLPLSALNARQRAVLLVLRRHDPVQQHLIAFWIARDQPATPRFTDDQITHALQMLYEMGWAEPTTNGWKARKENT